MPFSLRHRYNNDNGIGNAFVCLFCVSLQPAKCEKSAFLTVQDTPTGSGLCIVGARNLNSIVECARNGVFRVGTATCNCSL